MPTLRPMESFTSLKNAIKKRFNTRPKSPDEPALDHDESPSSTEQKNAKPLGNILRRKASHLIMGTPPPTATEKSPNIDGPGENIGSNEEGEDPTPLARPAKRASMQEYYQVQAQKDKGKDRAPVVQAKMSNNEGERPFVPQQTPDRELLMLEAIQKTLHDCAMAGTEKISVVEVARKVQEKLEEIHITIEKSDSSTGSKSKGKEKDISKYSEEECRPAAASAGVGDGSPFFAGHTNLRWTYQVCEKVSDNDPIIPYPLSEGSCTNRLGIEFEFESGNKEEEVEVVHENSLAFDGKSASWWKY